MDCERAFNRIADRSFRNDVHHMNPKVGTIDFPTLAKRNIQDLAVIERDVFQYEMHNGALVLKNPQYWPIKPDGTVDAYLRLEP